MFKPIPPSILRIISPYNSDPEGRGRKSAHSSTLASVLLPLPLSLPRSSLWPSPIKLPRGRGCLLYPGLHSVS